ncbi:MAG: ATP-dependent DNA ligase, partial [Candidatus Cyclobacteriaceae bacterium M3_2C_046]
IQFFNLIQQNGIEGIVSKRLESLYQPGQRTKEWIKIKCSYESEAFIIGYTTKPGEKYFSSLILADQELKPVGNISSGLNDKLIKQLHEIFQLILLNNESLNYYVEPRIRCLVKYNDKTLDGKLRAGVFLKLLA